MNSKLIIAVAATAIMLLESAHAIGNTPPPATTYDVTNISGSKSLAAAVSGSESSAISGSKSSAEGGAAVSGSKSSASADGTQDQSTSVVNEGGKSRSLALFLPPPVFTPPMAKVDCAGAMITQDAVSVLWSGFSKASAKTDSSDCTLINIRNAKVETCQYASAKQIEDLVVRRHLTDFKPTDNAEFIDYPPEKCALLRAPPKTEPQVSFVEVEKIVEVDRPCPEGWSRNSRGVCYDPAWIEEAKRLRACKVCR